MLSNLVESFLGFLHFLSGVVPLPVFAFLGSFIEEVVAPLPSPFVMMLAGSMIGLEMTKVSILYMVFTAAVGAIGKTLAGIIVYFVSDKAEDLVVGKWGKFLGLSKGNVEALGKYLDKNKGEFFVLFFLRAMPIFPSTPVSVVSGLIKVDIKKYINATFWGTTLRNVFYMLLGYSSFGAFEKLVEKMDKYEYFGYAILALAALGVFAYFRLKNKKDALFEKFIAGNSSEQDPKTDKG